MTLGPDTYETDVLELGERVALCLFAEELDTSSATLRDRTRSVALNLAGFIAVEAEDAGREVPDCWRSAFERRGMRRPS